MQRLARPPLHAVTPGPTEQLPRTLYTGPVYVHTHTASVVYSRRSEHVSNVKIACPFRPGQDGNEQAAANFRGFCGELDRQLAATASTMAAVHARSAGKLECRQGQAEYWDSAVGCRRRVNEGVAAQLELQNAMLRTWRQDPSAPLGSAA